MNSRIWYHAKLVLAVSTLLVLGACSRHRDRASLVDRSFLFGQPCMAPCWYGLEPDESTEEDVIRTLKTLSFVEPSTITVTKVVQGAPLVENEQRVWFDCREPEQHNCGLALLSGNRLKALYPPVQYALTMEAVVQQLGPPDSVAYRAIEPESANCEITLAWQQVKIIVVSFDNRTSRSCEMLRSGKGLARQAEATGLQYHSLDTFRMASDANSATPHIPWPGFASR